MSNYTIPPTAGSLTIPFIPYTSADANSIAAHKDILIFLIFVDNINNNTMLNS